MGSSNTVYLGNAPLLACARAGSTFINKGLAGRLSTPGLCGFFMQASPTETGLIKTILLSVFCAILSALGGITLKPSQFFVTGATIEAV